jgi:hypothetical protein
MGEVTNDAAPSVEPVDEHHSGEAAEFKRLGITARQHVSYEWNGYRYTNASDAIAAAKRSSR